MVPAPLRAWLSLHNGCEAGYLLPSAWDTVQPLAGGAVDPSEPAGGFDGDAVDAVTSRCGGMVKHGGAWPMRWVPFAWGGNGDYLCLDYSPGPAGAAGQVIQVGSEGDLAVLAPSLAAYFDSFADALAAGDTFTLTSDGNLEFAGPAEGAEFGSAEAQAHGGDLRWKARLGVVGDDSSDGDSDGHGE
jgi:cell wall assembly regulator SMI1